MEIVSGSDLVELARLEQALARHGDRFLQRVFTPAEIELCAGRVESLAARYAAKEAAAKALGTGIRGFGFLEIEILRGELGQPLLNLHGAAAERARADGWFSQTVSLSHTARYALAVVMALKNR
ncbi:MAG: holo-ACP synthase [Anaerolineales bacterium]